MPVTAKQAAPPQQTKHNLLQTLKEAIAGTKTDYTSRNLNQAILLLAIPMMLEMALESVFAVADLFWVGRLGSNALAAVGFTESLLTLIFAVGAGLSTSITALVARRIGENDQKRAAVDAAQAIAVGLLISVVLAAPLYIFAPELLALVGATAPVVHIGTTYARIALSTSGVIILISLNNAIFRGAGDAAFAMRVLWIANLINLVLDPLLIFGVGPFPKLGVAGPAVATLIGRSSGVLYQFYRLIKGTDRFRIGFEHICLNLREMSQFVRISASGILQFLLEQGSWLGIVRVVSLFGPSAIAGYTIAFRIVGFVLLPSMGLSNAAATLVGQHLGANLPDRARSSVWRTGLWNLAFLGSLSLALIAFAPFFVGLFTHDPSVKKTAVEGVRFFSYGNVLFSFGMVFLQAFNGAGDTLTPTFINLFGFWMLEIPLAWFLGRHTALKMEGIFVAIFIAQTVAVSISGFLFVRGRWTKAKAIAS